MVKVRTPVVDPEIGRRARNIKFVKRNVLDLALVGTDMNHCPIPGSATDNYIINHDKE